MSNALAHKHGMWQHEHHHHGPHRHLRMPIRSTEPDDGHRHDHDAPDHGSHEHDAHDHDAHDHDHDHAHGESSSADHEGGTESKSAHGHSHGAHGHTHGLVDPEIVRSRAGIRAVAWSLGVLGLTSVLQALVFALSNSVALLADLIHNVGDALTAIPLGIAFLLTSRRAERMAGYAVVLTIFVSAVIAAYEAIRRLIDPQDLDHLLPLALAGVVGFLGNELAARIRLRAGRKLDSPALIADGHHARVDGYVSLGVIASAAVVAAGLDEADPIIGLAITALILRITFASWRTVRA